MIEILTGAMAYLGQETSALAGAAIGGFVMYLGGKVFKMYKEYQRRKSASVVPQLLEADIAVYKTLTELLVSTSADRAYVVQFHNGVYYLNQANHMKLSCTHEIVKEGISRIQDDMQDLLLSKFAGPMKQTLQLGTAVFDIQDQPDTYFRDMLKAHGTECSIASIMIDGNIVEGAVVINYLTPCEDREINKAIICDHVAQAAKEIGFKLRGKRNE